MKPPSFSFFSLIAVVLGGAGGLGWWLHRPETSDFSALPVPEKSATKAVKMSGLPEVRREGKNQVKTAEEKPKAHEFPSSAVTVAVPNPVPMGNGGLAQIPQPISEQELITRAAQVEQEANHDLARLVNLLDLNDTQQDRIFDSLARNAPSWHPSMQTVGVIVPAEGPAEIPSPPMPDPAVPETPSRNGEPDAGKDLLDVIGKELTPDQQIQLANAELDRREWWEEIIPKLLPPEDIPSIIGTPPADPPPPVNKNQDEPGVLPE